MEEREKYIINIYKQYKKVYPKMDIDNLVINTAITTKSNNIHVYKTLKAYGVIKE